MTTLGRRAVVVTAACMALALGVSGCGETKTDGTAMDTSAAGTTMSTAVDPQEQQNKDISRQFIEEVLNKGNMAFADQHTATDFVEHTPSPGQESGLEGLKKFITEWRAAMPDLRIEVKDVLADGDLVTIHNHLSGTQQGPMWGMPATGKKIDINGVDIVRIKDGKMTEHWGYVEEAKMMQQLGMMPQPGTPPATGSGGGAGAMDTAKGSMDSKGMSDTAGNMGKK